MPSLLSSLDISIPPLSLSVPHQEKDDSRQDGDDRKEDHAGRCAAGVHVAALERLVVDEHGRRQRGVVRVAVVEHFRDIVHAQAADQAGDERVGQNRAQVGNRNAEEDLAVVGTVDLCRFIDFRTDAKHTGDQNDHRIAVPHPELDEGHDPAGGGGAVHEVGGTVPDAHTNQEIVDRSLGIAEEGVEQHGDGGGRNDVRHVENNLEEALSSDLVAAAGEPGRQNQRQCDLGNEVQGPEHDGVLEREKKEGQYFYITATMEMNLKGAGTTDKIENTVNYDLVVQTIISSFTETVNDTIEAAAEQVIEAVMSEFPLIQTLTVKVSKPNAPVDADFENIYVELTRSRHRVFLSIGSNLGDREGYLDMAIEEIDRDASVEIKKISSIIETEPYGPVEQPNFLNGVIELETYLDPDEFLSVICDIENEAGRERIIHWGPRTLDIDIIMFDDMIINTDSLIIPHPEMQNREFVLKPMAEIAPHIIHPVFRKSVAQLYEELKNKG